MNNVQQQFEELVEIDPGLFVDLTLDLEELAFVHQLLNSILLLIIDIALIRILAAWRFVYLRLDVMYRRCLLRRLLLDHLFALFVD